MLILPQTKALALKLNNPERVLASIPTAQKLVVRGHEVVVAPHGVEEVAQLNALGIDTPSPILYHYNWPGRYSPYDHQKETAAFLTVNRKGLVLNEIGTGKTQSALWAADYLMSLGVVEKALIISPLSTLERVWGDAIYMNFTHRKVSVLHGTADRRRRLLKQHSDFYVVNHDGFPIIAKEAMGMFDLVIVDEAAVLRNPTTKRFKSFRKWMELNPATRLWLMTGTPTPNEPTDAWALAKLIDSPFCTKTYTNFRDQVMTKISMYKYIPRPDSAEIVKHILQPAVRYTRDECFDLPDTVTQTRQVDLTPDQAKHYKQMMKHLITETGGTDGTITAVNEAVKMMKLVQIACGVAYGEDGNDIELDCAPRVKAVEEVIEEAGAKVIVFVPLTGTLRMLERELARRWTVAVVNGAVSSTQRDEIFYNFQHTDNPRILIAHPATMAHGLTLTAASTVIWYGPIASNEQYQQANGRVERIGKRHVSNVVHIQSTLLEQKIFERLAGKQKMQGLLLDMIQQEMHR